MLAESPRIGVLAVQGNVREHAAMLRRLGAEPVEVRKPEELDGLDGLVIPGGESTTFMRLMRLYGLDEAVRRFAGPVLGTCAGMIVLDRNHLGLVDVSVNRNAYGRQVASFEADLQLDDGEKALRGVFIRAPRVAETGPEVEVLAELDGEPVLLREGRFLVASFHPELTDDTRVHQLFLDLVHTSPSRPSDAPLGVRRAEGQYEKTAVRMERGQRREDGGAGLRPAGAVRSGGRDVGA
jgi:pyridoxal 5'-phosphate synthase pdxT subunit